MRFVELTKICLFKVNNCDDNANEYGIAIIQGTTTKQQKSYF